jgi:hypothetical protein
VCAPARTRKAPVRGDVDLARRRLLCLAFPMLMRGLRMTKRRGAWALACRGARTPSGSPSQRESRRARARSAAQSGDVRARQPVARQGAPHGHPLLGAPVSPRSRSARPWRTWGAHGPAHTTEPRPDQVSASRSRARSHPVEGGSERAGGRARLTALCWTPGRRPKLLPTCGLVPEASWRPSRCLVSQLSAHRCGRRTVPAATRTRRPRVSCARRR